MKLFTFSISHPAAETEPSIVTVPADTEDAARFLLDREIFFKQDLVNGYMFSVNLIRSAAVPSSVKSLNVITVQLPDGRVMEKAFK